MIKLKDILAESKNVELGKLITMKDDQPFMTEEQWNAKWETKSLLKEYKKAEKYMVLNESVYNKVFESVPDVDRPNISELRKSIIKFVNALRPNSKATKILREYLLTGKLSLSDAIKVNTDFREFTQRVVGGTMAVALLALSTKFGNAWVAWPFFTTIFGAMITTAYSTLIPRGEEAIYFDQISKKYPHFARTFKNKWPDSYKNLEPEQKQVVDKHIKSIKKTAFGKVKDGLFNISKKIFSKLK